MSFSVHNTNNEDVINELTYKLPRASTAKTVISRTRDSEPLLLDDFNTIHSYTYTGDGVAEFNINTLMVENAVYEIQFNFSGGLDRNIDFTLFPIPNYDLGSRYYTIFHCSEDDNVSVVYRSTVSIAGFFFDFYPGNHGYDPIGKITIHNDRHAKKIHFQASDTSSVVNGSGYWLDDSSTAIDYNALSTSPPPYNTTSTWTNIGQIVCGAPYFTHWRIRVSRIA